MNEIASEWIVKADNDYFSADILLHTGEVPIIDTAWTRLMSPCGKVNRPGRFPVSLAGNSIVAN